MSLRAMCEPRRRRGAWASLAITATVVLAFTVLCAGCYGFDYRFLATAAGGSPVAQRCGPMPFTINPHGAQARWQLDAVVTAVKRLGADEQRRAASR